MLKFVLVERSYKLGVISQTIKKKRHDVEIKTKELESFQEDMNKQLESIDEIEASFSKEIQELNASFEKLEVLKKEYKKVKQQKRTVDSILKDSASLNDKWQEERFKYQTLLKTLEGMISSLLYLK